ncbi:unnamed protein product [Closterium sp. Naga37s-1]|nr:unnamed protein product [Closterium sp. Naga37s-1]
MEAPDAPNGPGDSTRVREPVGGISAGGTPEMGGTPSTGASAAVGARRRHLEQVLRAELPWMGGALDPLVVRIMREVVEIEEGMRAGEGGGRAEEGALQASQGIMREVVEIEEGMREGEGVREEGGRVEGRGAEEVKGGEGRGEEGGVERERREGERGESGGPGEEGLRRDDGKDEEDAAEDEDDGYLDESPGAEALEAWFRVAYLSRERKRADGEGCLRAFAARQMAVKLITAYRGACRQPMAGGEGFLRAFAARQMVVKLITAYRGACREVSGCGWVGGVCCAVREVAVSWADGGELFARLLRGVAQPNPSQPIRCRFQTPPAILPPGSADYDGPVPAHEVSYGLHRPAPFFFIHPSLRGGSAGYHDGTARVTRLTTQPLTLRLFLISLFPPPNHPAPGSAGYHEGTARHSASQQHGQAAVAGAGGEHPTIPPCSSFFDSLPAPHSSPPRTFRTNCAATTRASCCGRQVVGAPHPCIPHNRTVCTPLYNPMLTGLTAPQQHGQAVVAGRCWVRHTPFSHSTILHCFLLSRHPPLLPCSQDFLRRNNTGKLLWQVLGGESARLCVFGINAHEERMWDELKQAGAGGEKESARLCVFGINSHEECMLAELQRAGECDGLMQGFGGGPWNRPLLPGLRCVAYVVLASFRVASAVEAGEVGGGGEGGRMGLERRLSVLGGTWSNSKAMTAQLKGCAGGLLHFILIDGTWSNSKAMTARLKVRGICGAVEKGCAGGLLHFILIDGTWSNSKAMTARLKEAAHRAWDGRDLPFLSLQPPQPSVMHGLRPQPAEDKTCTAAAASSLLRELSEREEMDKEQLSKAADAIDNALLCLLDALTDRRRSSSAKPSAYDA